ncbi:hypothetical protein COV93_04645, partial [Candidatus Woesearchaeota archaeon CG11_big_fil_rev_8_21_14_0_20_43_8]
MVKRMLAVYLLMVIIMLGVSMVEWSRPSGMAINVDNTFVDADSDPAIIELMGNDIFTDGKPTTSDIVSIDGIMLGDSMQQVLDRLGNADRFQTFPGNIVNLEYETIFDSEFTAMIIHLENDSITRMTVLPGFGSNLAGATRYGYKKEEVYKRFGQPDKMEPLNDYWVYYFDKYGIDVLMKNKVVIGYSFRRLCRKVQNIESLSRK